MGSVHRLVENLKLLRQQHGLTQEEFAAIAGFNYKYYQEIESGRKKQVLLETVDRLADAYTIKPSALIDDAVPDPTSLAKPRFPLPQKRWRRKRA
ncbi:XRE family transcriptional regulator [Opitutaceae bacterium TAV4]|uniref:helix-turn-helix domain-containing protein n=1 Tax=Geminisphaera colitermitum TaxID=1148786 RepID=UPI000158C85D|nr:helix-turn-helix transcriptional regulator [Geminisphaera colitermitum]RRJ97598.1 XRE family transcriptional regulator [Opitutaceae bacterium TAV4]RRK02016.1 XRE family transcriptional regulator [Opitutaceae bacterium TAV3]